MSKTGLTPALRRLLLLIEASDNHAATNHATCPKCRKFARAIRRSVYRLS